jgi:hypothetical protein
VAKTVAETPREVCLDVASGLTYADWTERLCRHFFKEERAQQPVTFFVDDDLLGALEGSGDPDLGVASLTAAVRSRLSRDTYGRRFARIDSECTSWKVGAAAGCPPSLPLLAVAVLAGTRMAREQGISKNNYWTRFRDLLDLQDTSDLKGINDVLPGLWEQLKWWLDTHNEGRLGRCTVEKDPWWTIIGYALSQALFRESDRQQLTELFRRIGLEPGEEIEPEELLQRFKAWAPGSPLSEGAKHMAADARYNDRLSGILADEASRWDGVLRDERGRRIGALVLAYEPSPRPVYTLAAERPAGFPSEALYGSNGFERRLTQSVDGWYGEVWPLEPEWLDEGLRLDVGEFVLQYRPAPIVPMARNRVLGCWASVGRIEPGEKYIVLADDAHANAVETFFGEHALDEWKREGAAFAPPGWTLFTGVTIEESPQVSLTGPLAVLAPSVRERPTLRGGLPLDATVALYLCGGEPDLWLPSLMSGEEELLVDGRALRASPGQRVPLRERVLGPGNHEVALGPARLLFTTAEMLRKSAAPGTGTVGHRIAATQEGFQAASAGATEVRPGSADELAVVGACLVGDPNVLPGSQPTVILPLNAHSYLLVGARPGQIARPIQPPRPPWLDGVGDGLFPSGFEVAPPFEVVWVIVTWNDGQVVARLRNPRPAEADASVPAADIAEWKAIFEQAPDLTGRGQELWAEYAEAAGQLPLASSARPPVTAAERKSANRKQAVSTARVEARARPTIAGFGVVLPLKTQSDLVRVYEDDEIPYQVTSWVRTGRWKVATRPNGDEDATLVGTYASEAEALQAIRARLDGQPAGSAPEKYELLLQWTSERGAGTWPQFRDAHDWLFNSGQQEGKQTKATTTIHGLSVLGHLEIDWDSGEWAVAPATLTILPNAGAHAVLCGARTRALLNAFTTATSASDLYSEAHPQEWGPNAIFVAAKDEDAVESLARRLGVTYELCVSERLAALLPPLDSYLELCRSTPAARGYGVERFDPRLLTFRRADTETGPGLYRYDLWGRPEFRFIADDGVYYKLDWALGVHAELRRCGKREIRYIPESVNGTLTVPFRAQLPALHARTAVLCSGLMPKLDNWKWHYPNVPLETATAIAHALGQELIIEPARREP